jgi:hydrophobe/amphiphile efflux-1 (HAE1) family protein
MFVPLKPWGERTASAQDDANYILGKGATISDAIVLAFNPPPIRGLGTSGGFEVYLQDRSTSDPRLLAQQLGRFTEALRKRPELTGINSFFRPTVPQLFVDVDEEKALALGVPVNTIFDALQATLGSLYVNDFNRSGRTFRVQIQADAPYRNQPQDIGNIYVRSATTNQMIPVKSVIRVEHIVGPEQIDRYNGFLAAKIIGNGAPGVSSGQAIATVEQVADATLPTGYTIEWTGQAYQEKRIGTTAIFAFVFAIIMVFLILSANYERWSLPVAVLLAVPFGLFGALVFVWLRGFTNDIYFQIGLLVLIGLAAKNAILIVEFAAQEQAKGLEAGEAAAEAARLRFRPIVMTSLAFILGTVPLAVAVGAGAAARQSMGTGVVGGMLAATFIATLFVPMFYMLLARRHRHETAAPLPPVPEEEPS